MALAGKRVVITGANGALGEGVIKVASEQGADLVLLDIAFTPEQTAAADGIQRLALDLTDLATTQAAFAELAKGGNIDALFNLAGGFSMGPTVFDASKGADDEWDFLFKLNVTTMRNAVKAAVPMMQQQGRGSIVNVGAKGALNAAANMGPYAASKSVVMRLTESLSAELKEQGINVNAVLPTVIDTARNRADMPDADPSQWVAPTDLGNVICFLGSDAARAVHGALVPVSGLS